MKKLALFSCMLAVTMFIVSCSDDEDTLVPEEENVTGGGDDYVPA